MEVYEKMGSTGGVSDHAPGRLQGRQTFRGAVFLWGGPLGSGLTCVHGGSSALGAVVYLQGRKYIGFCTVSGFEVFSKCSARGVALQPSFCPFIRPLSFDPSLLMNKEVRAFSVPVCHKA